MMKIYHFNLIDIIIKYLKSNRIGAIALFLIEILFIKSFKITTKNIVELYTETTICDIIFDVKKYYKQKLV